MNKPRSARIWWSRRRACSGCAGRRTTPRRRLPRVPMGARAFLRAGAAGPPPAKATQPSPSAPTRLAGGGYRATRRRHAPLPSEERIGRTRPGSWRRKRRACSGRAGRAGRRTARRRRTGWGTPNARRRHPRAAGLRAKRAAPSGDEPHAKSLLLCLHGVYPQTPPLPPLPRREAWTWLGVGEGSKGVAFPRAAFRPSHCPARWTPSASSASASSASASSAPRASGRVMPRPSGESHARPASASPSANERSLF